MNKQEIKDQITSCEKLLIGIGEEWQSAKVPDVLEVYEKLGELIRQKDYFVVTTNTDAVIYKSRIESACITAPCGNDTWRQCGESCTRDIWEPGEVTDNICPHCGSLMVSNTVGAKAYIEEGYLPQWNAYTRWLSATLNKRLLILELGVGFATPTVIRWPFEKTAFVNHKAQLIRVHETFSQVAAELSGRAIGIGKNSVEFIEEL